MKSELRCVPHQTKAGVNVFEVWHNGQFIAQLTGADGSGVRVISKHEMAATVDNSSPPGVVEVRIAAPAVGTGAALSAN